MQLTLSTYGGSSRVLKMGILGGWSPENGNFSQKKQHSANRFSYEGNLKSILGVQRKGNENENMDPSTVQENINPVLA